MNVSHFFIDRPIFAWVIAIIISIAGALAMSRLPISKYPDIAPPTVQVSASYLGASAKTVEDTVTQVIEQQMKGLDHLLYMASTSDAYGNAAIKLTFDTGTNPDMAQVQVQNRVQSALPLLPSEVQRMGVRVRKASASFLMAVAFYSEDNSMNNVDLSDYVSANILDPISRLDGVGDVQLFGGQYSMRIWLDPNKLFKYKLTPLDISNAIQDQNIQVSGGQLGGTPAVEGQQLTATITVQSRLQTVQEFENVLLRVESDGSRVFLKDVARVEIGSESYNFQARYSGKLASGIGINLAPGGNAIETSKRIRDKVNELSAFFPPGMVAVYPYDTTPFIESSIEEVRKTLLIAIFLVFCVMFVFLQSLRATLVPMITVPVVLLGTFGMLAVFGFSINMLTMFALVLAIGLIVDDAIVVVENVERLMEEEGLSPRDAARKSMTQITGALLGVVSVLCAAYVPMAFFGGATGVIYKQFSVTLASALLLSFMIAIVLTPALCATVLKQADRGHLRSHEGAFGWFNLILDKFFAWFNHFFDKNSLLYQSLVGRLVGKKARTVMMCVFVGVAFVVGILFSRLPTSFLPQEDQGAIMGMIMLPSGATQEQTLKVADQVEQYLLKEEEDVVQGMMLVAGFSPAGTGQNMGFMMVQLKDWEERSESVFARLLRKVGLNHSKDLSAPAVAQRASVAFAMRLKDAQAYAFVPPAIPELGFAEGFDMFLQDQAGLGHEALTQARNQLLGMAAQHPKLVSVRPNGQEDTQQLKINIDHTKAQAFGVPQSMINATLATAWGGSYVNDFLNNDRVKKVYIQADAQYRMMPDDLKSWYARNNQGEMVPFSSFATTEWRYGSPRLERYNGVPAMEIQGQAVQGESSGVAMDAMEALVAKLPKGVGMSWTATSFQERASGSTQMLLFALSIVVVFLCLAALYESWTIPLSVVLVIPVGILGLIIAIFLRGFSNDVYFKVALLTIIGLSSKNAILLVEFAKEAQKHGKSLIDATLEAVHIRLRPVLMTSLAFGFGVLPLALNAGPGSGAQNVIGTGVVGGMISTTMLGVFFTPVFFVVVRSIFKYKPNLLDTLELKKEAKRTSNDEI
ncbi:MAG: efflux RND transporter permease subunit [Burkholderiales bacterium]|jgi:multidrug efflux pump|nr:efflux RND transporter permease subunit [Burkholderiales bacterium]